MTVPLGMCQYLCMESTTAPTTLYRITVSVVPAIDGSSQETFELSPFAFTLEEAERAADDRAAALQSRYGVQAWARVQVAV